MSINFACTKCNQPYVAPDQAAGKQTRCRKCNETLTVPNGAAAPSSNCRAQLAGDLQPLAKDALDSLLDEALTQQNNAGPLHEPLQPAMPLAGKKRKSMFGLSPVMIFASGFAVFAPWCRKGNHR